MGGDMALETLNGGLPSPPTKISSHGVPAPLDFIGEVNLIILEGPPAAGKGTQCDAIKEQMGCVHLSTGEILRENVNRATELGKKVFEFLERGELVPDDLVIDIVIARLMESDVEESGCILDGFPRTLAQAQALSRSNVNPTRVIMLEVTDETTAARIVGRRLDPLTGTTYNLDHLPPQSEEVRGRLVQRKDDLADAQRVRMANYKENISAIADHYRDKLVRIDGNRSPSEVTQDVVEVVRRDMEA